MTGAKSGISAATVTLDGDAEKPSSCTGFRLPTESEWEYAFRAGDLTAFYTSAGNNGAIADVSCSDSNLNKIGWYCGNTVEPQVAGQKAANAWGLRDMSGNVWEWCHDGWGVYPAGTVEAPDEDPVVVGTFYRMTRGGSWYDAAAACRAANRAIDWTYSRKSNIGFRLARTL
jgi:formylglycine-generating enzyme required for sulfatase activity